jgi:alpha-tubulin suppressor-like RCC1 family protein
MRKTRNVRFLGVVVCSLALGVACADFEIPDDTPIACGADSACPPTWSCAEELGRCVPDVASDDEPPGLADGTTVEPRRAGIGTRVRFTIVASEDLGAPPIVRVTPERDAELIEGAGDRFVLEYVVVGDEPAQLEPIVELIDVFANKSTRDLDEVEIDLEGPTAVNVAFVLPAPKTRATAEDALAFLADTEASATIVEARLVTAGGDALALSADVINDAGVVNGSATTPAAAALAGVAELFLELELEDDLGNVAVTRSQALAVDLEPPVVDVDFGDGLGAERAVLGVELAVTATDAVQMLVEGDVEDGALVRGFGPVQSSVDVVVTEEDGTKFITVRVRDEAFNEASGQVAVLLNRVEPIVAPELAPEGGGPGVKAGDSLRVTGATESTATVDSAALVFVDGNGDPVCDDVPVTGVQAIDGALSGVVGVGSPCAGAAAVQVRVIVRSAAGVPSVAADSLSNSVVVDVDAPVITAALRPADAPDARAGQTPSTAVVLDVSATDANLAGAEVRVDGDVVSGAPVGGFVSLAPSFALELTSNNGNKAVQITVRDAVGNEATVTRNITLDTLAPAPPALSQITVVESVADAGDPAQAGEGASVFTVSGAANAGDPGARLLVFVDDDTTPSATIDLAGNGSFAGVAIPPGDRWRFVVIDDAGNPGEEREASRLRMSVAGAPASIGDAAFSVTVTVTGGAVIGDPALALGSAAVSLVSSGGGVFTYDVDADAGDAPEGIDAAVLRATATPAGLGGGSVAIDAVAVTVDHTAPVITAGALALAENPSGSADTLTGNVGAVTDAAGLDDVTAARPFSVEIQGRAGQSAVAADGAFAALDLGDNQIAGPVLVATDAAGNVASLALLNDIAPPGLSVTATPAVADGDTVTIDVTVTDGAHPLAAAPVVTVAGRATTRVDVEGLDVDQGAITYQYTYVVDDLVDAQNPNAAIAASASDTVGNAGSGGTTTRVDFSAPTLTSTVPGETDPALNAVTTVSGSSSDVGGGTVAFVEVEIRDLTDGTFFNGGGFSPGAQLVTAENNGWFRTVTGLTSGHDYEVRARATDDVGNQSGFFGPFAFSFDNIEPDTIFDTPPADPSPRARVPFVVSSSEPGSTFLCSVDGFPPIDCDATGPVQVTVGTHLLEVTAVDPAGNADSSPAQASFTVERALDASIRGGIGCAVGTGVAGRDGFAGVQCWGDNSVGQLFAELNVGPIAKTRVDPTVLELPPIDHTAVAVGLTGTMCISDLGSLQCWGDNTDLAAGLDPSGLPPPGPGEPENFVAGPTFVPGVSGVVSVSLGDRQGCAVQADGRLFCWGRGFDGGPDQLPFEPDFSNTGYTKVAVSPGGFACALDGPSVRCWGTNQDGQLGRDTNGLSDPFPGTVSVPGPAIDVGVGDRHACALTDQLHLFCWGADDVGQLTGQESIGPGFPGQVVVSPLTTDLERITSLGVGRTRTCGVAADGLIYCHGAGPSAELGDGFASGSPNGLVQAAGGLEVDEVIVADDVTCGRVDAALHCVGETARGQIVNPGDALAPSNIAPAQFGARYVIEGDALCEVADFGGGLSCAGQNPNNNFVRDPFPCSIDADCGVGGRCLDRGFFQECDVRIGSDELTPVRFDVTHAALGDGWGCIVRNDNQVFCAGRIGNHLGRFDQVFPPELTVDTFPAPVRKDDGTTFVPANAQAFAANDDAACLLQDDFLAPLVCWGDIDPIGDESAATPVPFVGFPPGGGFDAQMAMGDAHGCFTQNSEVFCWGADFLGQLGRNTTGNPPEADIVLDDIGQPFFLGGGGGPAPRLAAAGNTTCAIKDSQVFCWGSNANGVGGQLPPDAPSFGPASVATPTAIETVDLGGVSPTSFVAVAVGADRACAVSFGGELVCWGEPLEPDADEFTEDRTPRPFSVGGWFPDTLIVGDDVVCGMRDDGDGPGLACIGDGTGGVFGNAEGFVETFTQVVP